MIKKSLLLILFISVYSAINAQQEQYDRVKREYISFDYEKVIILSEELLSKREISDSLLIDTYLMRAASFYALGNEQQTKDTFLEILHINKDYSADPSSISPKLITLFNDVKSEFLSQFLPSDNSLQSSQSFIFDDNLMRGAVFKNTLVPGWGQLHAGLTIKGAALTSISTISLVGMIYYITDANKKENEYLRETNKVIIQQKYSDFNKSYKLRNTFIIAYAAIWLYSQLDILFFNDSQIFYKKLIDNESVSIQNDGNNLLFSLKICF